MGASSPSRASFSPKLDAVTREGKNPRSRRVGVSRVPPSLMPDTEG